MISGFGAPSGSQGMTTSPFRAASMLSGNGYFANVGLKDRTRIWAALREDPWTLVAAHWYMPSCFCLLAFLSVKVFLLIVIPLSAVG